MSLAFVLFVTAFAQCDTKAEQLFAEMERKLSRAKTLSCRFEIKVENPKKRWVALTGSISFSEGKKAHLGMEGKYIDQPFKLLMVSDGAKARIKVNEEPARDQEMPQKLHARFLRFVQRSGVFLPLLPWPDTAKTKDLLERLPVSELRLGTKANLFGRKALVIQYRLMDGVPVTLWLDEETKLPLKRVINLGEKMNRSTITETYADMALDETIDNKRFEVPK